MPNLFVYDNMRYKGKLSGRLKYFLKLLRFTQGAKGGVRKTCAKVLLKMMKSFYGLEISEKCSIGPGLYLGHAFNITINPATVIGNNCNIHKGVTIGQENRGKRKGAPVIGNKVWIGVNATIVGKITIGDDVLIAPNSYVNRDIPSHSIVLGNPCIIKNRENATEGYINNLCELPESNSSYRE